MSSEHSTCDEYIERIDAFIGQNFENIEKELKKKLSISTFCRILSSESLLVTSEDDLLNFVLDLYKEDRSYSDLFQCILFKNVNENTLRRFIEEINVDDITRQIWISFNETKISKQDEKEIQKNKRYKKGKEFKKFNYTEGHEFEGILRHLTNETGGNIHENGTVEITTNNLNSGYPPKNLVYYDKNNHYNPNNTRMCGSLVCFNFKDKLVQLSSYSIKSDKAKFLKSWIIEVSKDGNKWIEVDRHENETKLKGSNYIGTFKLAHEQQEFYQFIRLVETGTYWDSDNYDGNFSLIEFFGKLTK